MGAFLANDSAAVRARDRMVLRVAAEQLHQRVGQHGLQRAQFGIDSEDRGATLLDLRLCTAIRRHLERSVRSPDLILRPSGCATVLSVSDYAVPR